ncbi:MAG TPA: UvrD-helicase domain-containing protein [Acidimicrobiales bacterium]|nr:UvrD-helicase domain-containing protein [Acidimicrobiales bacterium]
MSANKWFGEGWSITVTGTEVTVTQASGSLLIGCTDASRLEVRRHWLRWSLDRDGLPLVRLPGISKHEASALARALWRLALTPAIADAVAWHAAVSHHLSAARGAQRWIPAEAIDALLSTHPNPGLLDRIRAAGLESSFSEVEREAVAFLDTDLALLVADTNEHIMAVELVSRRQFFDTIEKSPLTEEQARAVVCFDNRVQVLAAAGSGKTSVMVARAAYAVSRGLVAPDRILMLAFNKNAATELQERVSARFAAAGIDSSGLRASTFHSFGLEVIGRATGEKPRLAPWLDQGEDVRMVLRIVDDLRDSSETFRYRWDLYRMLFANIPTDLTEDAPNGYDKTTRATGYRTFAGQVVKSHSERLIANFLFLNGVDYVYERPYDVQVADAAHSQYRPDFYYPDIGVWHEHWALDRDGEPPTAFLGYAQDMAWKRRVHAQYGTTLIESTWAEVMFDDGLSKLKDELTRLGLKFDWSPDRPVNDEWAKPLRHEDLAQLVRTFMAHVKSNSSSTEDIEHRLASTLAHLNGYRTRLFLDLYWQISAEWERRLAAERTVDFEDMLVQAAAHLETGGADSPYELIMVDEFQDASQARARLVRGLVKMPGRFLLAVGDDWQSINRFAGADLSVMRNFEAWFGRGCQVALTTTFRCTQTICDVARAFVSKNPNQFDKAMRSARQDPGAPVTVILADDAAGALASHLDRLSVAIADGSVKSDHAGMVSVDVLGRYWFERDVLPRRPPSNLHVTFRTVHGSKGLEADYIVVPGMTTGVYGFPSGIADDPVLDLAIPAPETFAHAEERRLLYVALTRARLGVTLITPPRRMSRFVVELLEDPRVTVVGNGDARVEICSQCGQGTMVERTGRFGRFLGCSTFPACTNTRALK